MKHKVSHICIVAGVALRVLSASLLAQSPSPSAIGPFFVGVYIIPPPDQPEIDVRIDFLDADTGDNLGGITKHIKGSKKITETLTPRAGTKRVTIKFEPLNVTNYRVKPAEKTMDLTSNMEASSITWIASVSDDKAYLDNVTTAGSILKKKDADGAIERAAYAGAVATTSNQRIEAARVEAEAHLAKGDPAGALNVFDRVSTEGIDKADPVKQKVFLGEWLDMLEEAAIQEGATADRDTGYLFGSLKSDSRLRKDFEMLSEAFGTVVPSYKQKASNLRNDAIAEKERLLRVEMASILRELRQRQRQPSR
jgi:hypothetical protein